jgi:integrase
MIPLTMRIFCHPNGYWYAELERNRRRSLGTRNKAEAQKLYRRLKSEFLLAKVTFLDDSRPVPKSLEDFAAEYLDWVYQGLAFNTYAQARSGFKSLMVHIPPSTSLSQITRRQVDVMQGSMAREVKASSVNTRFRIYRAACSKAVEWGYLEKNPFAGVKPLKEQEAFPRYLTHAEIATILGAETNRRYLALWQTLLLTGCRRREIVTLTWADIDLPGRRIFIRTTKNKKPRIVWIVDDLLQILQQLNPGVGRLFPWGPRQASRRFQMLCLKAGIKARLHDLRHTYGSYLAMAGVDLLTIGTLMGHLNIKSTQIYAHLSPEHLALAQTKLANALNLRAATPETSTT